jgi:hypothetical protein
MFNGSRHFYGGNLMDKIVDAVISLIGLLVGGFDLLCKRAQDILAFDITDGILGSVYNVALEASTVLSAVATSICGLCFFIEFIKISIKMDMLKWETAISLMIKFAIARAALDIAPEFLLAIYGKGSQVLNGLKAKANLGGDSFSGTVVTGIEEALKGSAWQAILPVIAMLVLFLGVLIIGIMIVVMAYGRMFELILYCAVCPIPAAFLCLENSQITKKFFLDFAAVVVQGIVMIIIIGMFRTFAVELIDNVDTAGGGFGALMALTTEMLIAVITLLTLMMKSGQVAKAALGQA